MTFINDAPDDVRERLRGEILANVETRQEEARQAFSFLVNFMGIVLSGAMIAILGFLGTKSPNQVPVLGVLSFLSFGVSLLSFAVFLYLHYQLHVARWNYYAEVADGSFQRRNSLEDVLEAMKQLRALWLFRLMFWVPFSFAVLGFVMAAAAASGFDPAANGPTPVGASPVEESLGEAPNSRLTGVEEQRPASASSIDVNQVLTE